MRWTSFILLAILATAATPRASAQTLTTDGGFSFDIIAEGSGGVRDGTDDAYDTAYVLEVNGTGYDAGGAPIISADGRTVTMGIDERGTLTIQRVAYVPARGGDFIRWVDIIENTGSTDEMASIVISGDLGSDSSTTLFGTSSGDLAASVADDWAATDDIASGGDPAVGHVFQGPGGELRASEVTFGDTDDFEWVFDAIVPAGGRIALMSFSIQKRTREAVLAEAMSLAELSDVAIEGLDEYLDDIVNFMVAVEGAPRIRITGPGSANEGEAFELVAEIMDPEGDGFTFDWDRDDDGEFGEAPGALRFEVPAGTTDGDGAVRVGIRATDGENEATRYRSIRIINVPPEVTSTPEEMTVSVGATFEYQMVVEDPAGEADPLEFELVTGPSSMSVSDTGFVSWIPTDADVTDADLVQVVIRVNDGDDGIGSQQFALRVLPNQVPEGFVLIHPPSGTVTTDGGLRFVVGNARDADFDELVYHFEIDTVDTFDSPAKLESGPQPQGNAVTEWRPELPLTPGRYFWQAWASDGMSNTTRIRDVFTVVDESMMDLDAGIPDVGLPDVDTSEPIGRDPGDVGCRACAAHGSDPSAPGILFASAAFGLLLLRRRR